MIESSYTSFLHSQKINSLAVSDMVSHIPFLCSSGMDKVSCKIHKRTGNVMLLLLATVSWQMKNSMQNVKK
jgi:hypothetical protein